MGKSFTHLHLHTEYSMLDGAARVADVVRAAVADGQPAIGMTDHGNMYGAVDFYEQCKKNGLNPILGFEAYMAGESRFDRPPRRGRVDDTGGDAGDGSQKLYYHLTLLAENNAGYQNLMKLSSYAFLEGYYYQPRLDWELLEKYSEGVIATSGCLGGVVLQSLLHGDIRQATKLAGRLQDIFGRDNFFIELQDHGLDEQRRTNPLLLEIAKEIQAPLLATNDGHYTDRADAASHDALLCVQTNATMDDPNRFHFHGDEHYFKSAAEMRHLFSELPEACDSSLWIAERANVTIDFDRAQLPEFPLPTGFPDDDSYLRHWAYEGARERYGDELPREVTERLDYELRVIGEMGFSAYFLIVGDLIRHARERRIRVGPGRGSAAGCCVAFCLGITNLDPIRFDLLFERFLNPGRKQMPDIDMDFDDRYRGEMIRYVADKYGRDRLAQIVTFSTIKARAAVRDAAHVLGYPYVVGDKIAKAMPPLIMGRDTPIGACLNLDPMHEGGFKMAGDLRTMYETDPDARKVIDVAKGLEGLRRQSGIHASAVVISREPLMEYCPVQRKPESGVDIHAPIVTQYEGPAIEKLGLLKMDFLGLRNLTVIEQALDLIEANTGERPDVDNIPLDDEPTLALLRTGETIGVFQLEGGPMRALVRALAPTSFEDVSALIALYRPGPMAANMHYDYADRKNGRKPVEYIHPEMEELLGDTYGLMIYQESMMRVAQRFAGYSLSEADNLRKAAGKKVRAIMAAEREKFVDGCEKTGYGAALGKQLFDIIEPFADYAFNKSHSFAYGLVSWQTAWLKAHHPVEYFAALLTSVRDDKDATAKYLSECRNLGIEVQVPDVNVSVAGFGARGRIIPFGMAAVRNVGQHLVAMIVSEREANGPYIDFYDFCQRVDPMVLNKRSIDSLIKSGAFDSLGHPRQGLCLAAESIVDLVLQRRHERDVGVMSLFDTVDETGEASWDDTRVPIAEVEFDKMTRLAFEKEMLGLYVSDHPLKGAEATLRRLVDCGVAEARELEDGSVRVVGGVVTSLQRKWTKRGDLMATFVLEDLDGAIEVMVFPKTMQEWGSLLADDVIVCVKARVSRRDDELTLTCLEVRRPEINFEAATRLDVHIPAGRLTDGIVDQLKALLLGHPGDSDVVVHSGDLHVRLPAEFRVNPGSVLISELKVLLGPGAVM